MFFTLLIVTNFMNMKQSSAVPELSHDQLD